MHISRIKASIKLGRKQYSNLLPTKYYLSVSRTQVFFALLQLHCQYTSFTSWFCRSMHRLFQLFFACASKLAPLHRAPKQQTKPSHPSNAQRKRWKSILTIWELGHVISGTPGPAAAHLVSWLIFILTHLLAPMSILLVKNRAFPKQVMRASSEWRDCHFVVIPIPNSCLYENSSQKHW